MQWIKPEEKDEDVVMVLDLGEPVGEPVGEEVGELLEWDEK